MPTDGLWKLCGSKETPWSIWASSRDDQCKRENWHLLGHVPLNGSWAPLWFPPAPRNCLRSEVPGFIPSRCLHSSLLQLFIFISVLGLGQAWSFCPMENSGISDSVSILNQLGRKTKNCCPSPEPSPFEYRWNGFAKLWFPISITIEKRYFKKFPIIY